MRFYGDRRRQWIGYIMLLLIIGLAALSRNRHRAGSLQGKIDGGNQGYDAHPLANQSAGVYQPPTPSQRRLRHIPSPIRSTAIATAGGSG